MNPLETVQCLSWSVNSGDDVFSVMSLMVNLVNKYDLTSPSAFSFVLFSMRTQKTDC